MSTAQTPTRLSSFDPARPLEHTTLRNFRATGVGQASPSRLNGFIALGLTAGATIVLAFPRWWLLATPLMCLACFGVWGRAAQTTHLLDVKHERRTNLRRVLRAIRWTMVALGASAALAGIIGLVVLLMEPNAI